MKHGNGKRAMWIMLPVLVAILGVLFYKVGPGTPNEETGTVQVNRPLAEGDKSRSDNKDNIPLANDDNRPLASEDNKPSGDLAGANGNNEYSEVKPLNWNGYLGNDPDKQDHPATPELTWMKDLNIPEYSGEAYIRVNQGHPFFDTEKLVPESWEMYYDLDELGRCTLADAVVGQDTMPTEKRGSISAIKPTGWHSSKYSKDLVNGESLYNRCHLIAFGMCGETANQYNLITGTRYFNTDGINDLENMVIEYVRSTNNHVRYRVTPVFSGDNLVADGQLTEAWSIEDNGEGICFCVYSYNVQPGISIDYETGDNWLEGEDSYVETKPTKNEPQESNEERLGEDQEGEYVLNVKTKKIHSKDCEAVANMSEKNRMDYIGSYNDLIDQGYEPDKACLEKKVN